LEEVVTLSRIIQFGRICQCIGIASHVEVEAGVVKEQVVIHVEVKTSVSALLFMWKSQELALLRKS
jgi:hypothetical protein